jgi:hypothetical protein
MAENDFINDLADDADRELEASTPQYGNKNNNRAGLEDILVRQQSGGFNPIREVITGSENPSEYWVRTNLSSDEIQD